MKLFYIQWIERKTPYRELYVFFFTGRGFISIRQRGHTSSGRMFIHLCFFSLKYSTVVMCVYHTADKKHAILVVCVTVRLKNVISLT